MTDMSDEEFREDLERNSDKVLEILNEEIRTARSGSNLTSATEE